MITNIFKELKEKKLLQDLALKSYNAAATRMNEGMCEAFNKIWESKGKEIGTKAYEKAYEKLFNKVWTQEITKLLCKEDKFLIEQIKRLSVHLK